MDEFKAPNKIAVIGATNFIEGADKALLRTERLDKKFTFRSRTSPTGKIFRIY